MGHPGEKFFSAISADFLGGLCGSKLSAERGNRRVRGEVPQRTL
jgi:hypothetical protein